VSGVHTFAPCKAKQFLAYSTRPIWLDQQTKNRVPRSKNNKPNGGLHPVYFQQQHCHHYDQNGDVISWHQLAPVALKVPRREHPCSPNCCWKWLVEQLIRRAPDWGNGVWTWAGRETYPRTSGAGLEITLIRDITPIPSWLPSAQATSSLGSTTGVWRRGGVGCLLSFPIPLGHSVN